MIRVVDISEITEDANMKISTILLFEKKFLLKSDLMV